MPIEKCCNVVYTEQGSKIVQGEIPHVNIIQAHPQYRPATAAVPMIHCTDVSHRGVLCCVTGLAARDYWWGASEMS